MKDARFLLACRRQHVDATPIWIMRQAGRYLPEYRETRARAGDFLTLCKTPELACEATLQPIRIFGLDAAIVFSDILIPLEAMGLDLAFTEGEGPKLSRVKDAADIARLRVPDPAETAGFLLEAVRLIRRELPQNVPLIGFAGAPFTLATYAVEGGTSRRFRNILAWLYERPEGFTDLMDKLADTAALFLRAQVEAGADAVQIFDTWAGILSRRLYREFAMPYTARIVEALKGLDVPVILYANGSSPFLEEMAATGVDVVSVDWRTSLAEAASRTRGAVALQGNMDPMALFGGARAVEREAARVLSEAPATGHIFNLGHGIQPETPVEAVHLLVETVRRLGRKEP